jgi:hypothetical protein
MRVIICSFLLVCLSLTGVARADDNLDKAAREQLDRLEQKYFGHAFSSDADESRAVRLEELIFGENGSGNPACRIRKILSVSPAENLEAQSSSSGSAAAPTAARNARPTGRNRAGNIPASAGRNPGTAASQSLSAEDAAELRDYPHIDALEQSILGRTFAGDPLSARMARLETKAFGSPSMLPDLSQRTDALEEYAQKKMHQKPFASEPAGDSTASLPDAQSAPAKRTFAFRPANQPDYPRITALEKNLLGETHVGQDIASRLGRLETTAFGQPSASNDFSQRTDALDRYCQKKAPKKQGGDRSPEAEFNSARTTTANAPSSGVPGKALCMVANTLLGVAGMGMGPLGAMPRFGSTGPRSGRQQQADPVNIEMADDPAMFTMAPPPPDARLLTKVGWCEVKTFGHTFGSMHLTDRLRQLSQQLEFDCNKSDLELMDDIAALIKVVQSRQTGNTGAIGTVPQPAVR